jgi:hypothetical protein
LQLEHVLRKRIVAAAKVPPQSARGALIGARRASQTEIDAAG